MIAIGWEEVHDLLTCFKAKVNALSEATCMLHPQETMGSDKATSGAEFANIQWVRCQMSHVESEVGRICMLQELSMNTQQ